MNESLIASVVIVVLWFLLIGALLARVKWVNEHIDGNGAVSHYLRRWGFKAQSGRAIYIHKFTDDDWSLDLHDHPKWFLSIGLWGSYGEQYLENPQDGPIKWRLFVAPWVRWFPATHVHRQLLKSRTCWTLCITGKNTRDWGFWQTAPEGHRRWTSAQNYVSRNGGKANEHHSLPKK